jgi:hypothetical protein
MVEMQNFKRREVHGVSLVISALGAADLNNICMDTYIRNDPSNAVKRKQSLEQCPPRHRSNPSNSWVNEQ